MDQIITEVIIDNKAMIKRVKTFMSFVFMQLVFIVVLYFLEGGYKSETAGVLLALLAISCVLMIVRIIAREPRKIIFTADQINLHYLFVTKSVSSYELTAVDLLSIKKKPAKRKLVNQHLYRAPYITLQMTLGDRTEQPRYTSASKNVRRFFRPLVKSKYSTGGARKKGSIYYGLINQ